MKLKSKVLSIVSAVCVGGCSMFSAKQNVSAMIPPNKKVSCCVVKSSSFGDSGKEKTLDRISKFVDRFTRGEESILYDLPSVLPRSVLFRGEEINFYVQDTPSQEKYREMLSTYEMNSDVVLAFLEVSQGKLLGQNLISETITCGKKLVIVLVNDDGSWISKKELTNLEKCGTVLGYLSSDCLEVGDLTKAVLQEACKRKVVNVKDSQTQEDVAPQKSCLLL